MGIRRNDARALKKAAIKNRKTSILFIRVNIRKLK